MHGVTTIRRLHSSRLQFGFNNNNVSAEIGGQIVVVIVDPDEGRHFVAVGVELDTGHQNQLALAPRGIFGLVVAAFELEVGVDPGS